MSTNLLTFKAALIKGKLPILDATLARFNMLIDRPATTNQHLAEIIRSDIGYTAAVFRTVNSNLAKGRDAIESINHAIAMLGIAKIADIGNQLIPFSKLGNEPRQALETLYSRAFHAAQYFEALAMQQKLSLIEENTKAIKLMSLAQVALWTNNPDVIQKHDPEFPATLIGDFKEPLDNQMRELALELAIAWSLPATLQQALSPGFAAYTNAVSMTIADGIAQESCKDWHSPQTNYLYDLWSDLTETPVERIAGTIHELAAVTARQIYERQLPQPAFFIIQPATPKNVAEEPQESVKQKTPLSLQDIITGQMRKMQQNAGVSRVIFAMLTPDRKNLKVRFVMGGNKTDGIRQFKTDLSQKSIFSLLMQKSQGIHISTVNLNKFLPLIPLTEQKSLKVDNLFAMSFFIKNKPIGVFIADNNDMTLNQDHYKHFKLYCSQAAKALGN